MDGVSRIEPVGSPSPVPQPAPAVRGPLRGRGERVVLPTPEASLVAGQAVLQREKEPGILLIGSKAHAEYVEEGPRLTETYVRIRYDEGSRTYLIQIRNASNDEVIREIPPEAWARSYDGFPLPTGILIEKER